MLSVLLLMAILAALGFLAVRFGADSRPGADELFDRLRAGRVL